MSDCDPITTFSECCCCEPTTVKITGKTCCGEPIDVEYPIDAPIVRDLLLAWRGKSPLTPPAP